MTIDPWSLLGLPRDATLDEVRAARRKLALDAHPDLGGSAERMQAINAAVDAIVGDLTGRRPLRVPADGHSSTPTPTPTPSGPADGPDGQTATSPRQRRNMWRSGGVDRDAPSFVIEALPVEAFEALLVVTAWMGEVLVDDPPYVLEVHLFEPLPCWCRLDLVPDAGASTVSLTVTGIDGSACPAAEDVRDVWVSQLNRL